MIKVREDIENYLATAEEMLAAEGMTEAAALLRTSTAKVDMLPSDSWDGVDGWIIKLIVSPGAYAKLGRDRKTLEEEIDSRLKPVLEQFTNDWFAVKILPRVEPRPEWRQAMGEVSFAVRQNICDGLKIEQVVWCGDLNEVEFLQRLFNLESMPSNDSRFGDTSGDIWQHRINNPFDWPDDWIYGDPRFNLLRGPSDVFLRFLCEMVHPVVRPDRGDALKLVQHFNDQLRRDGWNLLEEEKIAGRPCFVARRIQDVRVRSVSRAQTVADSLDAGWMEKEIMRLENAVISDPALAIGTAKDLVETCCKTILSKRQVEFTRSADLPELTKLLAKELKLVPEGISDEVKGGKTVRLILHNLSALTQYLAELRGLYGSGHGRDGKHLGLEPRHARLAVGAAVAFIDFVTETHHQRPPS